jgi:hypothetical protein
MAKYWLESKIIKNSLWANVGVILLVVIGVTPSGKGFWFLESEQLSQVKFYINLFLPVILGYLNSSTMLERLNPTIQTLWSESFLPGRNRPIQ